MKIKKSMMLIVAAILTLVLTACGRDQLLKDTYDQMTKTYNYKLTEHFIELHSDQDSEYNTDVTSTLLI